MAKSNSSVFIGQTVEATKQVQSVYCGAAAPPATKATPAWPQQTADKPKSEKEKEEATGKSTAKSASTTSGSAQAASQTGDKGPESTPQGNQSAMPQDPQTSPNQSECMLTIAPKMATQKATEKEAAAAATASKETSTPKTTNQAPSAKRDEISMAPPGGQTILQAHPMAMQATVMMPSKKPK